MSGAPDLATLQRWFLGVITHPDGVSAGLDAADDAGVEAISATGPGPQPTERLEIYANAYLTRLVEVLADTFPLLRRALGAETFDAFAVGYLQAHPPRSYTLGRLSEAFADWLEENRPRDGEWASFFVDLARLEQAIADVFDGPGTESREVLSPGDLLALSPEQWATAKLVTAPCLRLLAFRFPVNDSFTSMRQAGDDEEIAFPAPREQWVALSRSDYVVRRHELERAEHSALTVLAAGRPVGEAITMAVAEAMVPQELEARLEGWFRRWTSNGFFVGVQ